MIDARRLTGPRAGVAKYDVLTALSLIGMHGAPHAQVSMLRLIAAVTARYNWRDDEMTIGQCELARLWGVAERTAKREVRRLTELRLILVKRPGVRGRVASYRLGMAELVDLSRPHWEVVGPDFAERMAMLEPAGAKVVRLDFATGEQQQRLEQARPQGTWGAVSARLRAEDPAAFANWYAHLAYEGTQDGEVHLRAASPFVGRYVETHLSRPLTRALEAELGAFHRIRILNEP